MSSDGIQSFPTFVDLNASHMAVSSDDQPMAITVFVDQPSSGINDSDSTTTIQQQPVKEARSPEDQDVYETDASSADDSSHVWVKEEVALLFKLYKDRQKDINDPHRKKRDVWVEIAADLKNYGYNPTPKQCDRKLRNMKATYIKTLDRIKRGDNMATCQSYDDLYDIYGLNPPLQTPPRLLLQNRNRPVQIKNEYANGSVSMVMSSTSDSYEPAVKKFIAQSSLSQKQDIMQEHMNNQSISPFQREKCVSPLGFVRQHPPSQKIITDLQEELNAVKKALEAEKEGREADRKAFEEERKEFHKERMSMLGSINKLIGNMDQQSS